MLSVGLLGDYIIEYMEKQTNKLVASELNKST